MNIIIFFKGKTKKFKIKINPAANRENIMINKIYNSNNNKISMELNSKNKYREKNQWGPYLKIMVPIKNITEIINIICRI